MRKIDPFHYGRIEKDEVNQQAFENYFQLIDEAERFYNDQIRRVVKSMSTGKDKTDVICLSGPSASGKTTTAHTLARHFISSGRRAMVISLDDFYLDTEKTPLNRRHPLHQYRKGRRRCSAGTFGKWHYHASIRGCI